MEKLLLTPLEAAEQLGIGRSTLYELLRAGQIASVRIGGCRRLTPTALSRYVERLEAASDGLRAPSLLEHLTAAATEPDGNPDAPGTAAGASRLER